MVTARSFLSRLRRGIHHAPVRPGEDPLPAAVHDVRRQLQRHRRLHEEDVRPGGLALILEGRCAANHGRDAEESVEGDDIDS